MQDNDGATQIRGSGLLLAGRFISIGAHFVAQILIVRYLAKSDFGALAFALAVVSLAASIAAFGLDKATSRFLPIYQERGDVGRVLGLLCLGVGLMTLIGLALIALVAAGSGQLGALADPTTIGVLLVLMALAPIQALDPLATSILAALSDARTIFVRRYILAPALQLAVIGAVIATAAGLGALAIGLVAAGVIGLAISAAAVLRALHRAGYMTRAAMRRVVLPWREVLSYSVPLLSSDLVFVLRGALVVVLLEVFGSALDVADFRAVFPQARLNLVVLQSFTFLFLPLAARLHERNDLSGLRDLHGRTSAWVALMSFPLVAGSLVLAEPLVGLLYGEQYATSAPILAILSAGFFLSAVLGFGGLTLRAIGRVRFLVSVDLLTAAGAVVAYLLLIPPLGAFGAAVATTATLGVQALAYHVGARRAGAAERGLGLLDRMIVASAVACVGLALVQAWLDPPLWVGITLVLAAWVALLWRYRSSLDIAGIFPEIRRVPVIGGLLGGPAPSGRPASSPPEPHS